MATSHEAYMQRCIDLAHKGAGYVAPNPMVGAVLVYEDRIIGEGYHQQYGQAHAEVNCIASVIPEDQHLIPFATIYVSLEPCAHFGKTPPCADLIIDRKIPKVVIGCRDSYREVDGKGMAKLRAAGIEVIEGILEKECRELNRRFFCFQEQQRPFVLLKWAQTLDVKMAGDTTERLLISNEYTNRLVHQWRSEEAGILVGTRTALLDDPSLTNRLWPGPTPVRMVLDMELALPASLHLMDGLVKTIVFNKLRHEESDQVSYYQIKPDVSFVSQLLQALYQLKIQSVMVEGGARLLQSFINEGVWDETRIITNTALTAGKGLPAPVLTKAALKETYQVSTDRIEVFMPQ